MKDRIDVTLTTEQAAGITTAIAGVGTAMPFLISLSPADRKYMVKPGNASEGFIQGTLELARQNPDLVPALVDLTKLERDLALRDAMAAAEAGLSILVTKVNHTRRLANADLYEGCLDIYHELQRHGNDQGMDAVVAPLRERFKRKAVVPTDENPEAPAE